MTPSRDSFESLLLGAIAVDLGYATSRQVEDALAGQDSSLDPRPLGELLVAGGVFDAERLAKLLDEQRRRATQIAPARLFGQIAVEKGYITSRQLGECIRDQIRAFRAGRALPIGQILIKKGYLTRPQFIDVVKTQGTAVLVCQKCQATFGQAPGGALCPTCGGDLVEPDRFEDAADEPPVSAAPSTGIWTRVAEPVLHRVGKYEVTREIARGSMAVVMKAVDTSLGRTVALKILKEGATDPAFIERLQREAKIAARLQHPNIVAIHEVGSDDGLHFLCMDYIEGLELNDHIRVRDLSRAEAVEILERVARAVHFAHERGVVHRDLKPANIIVRRDHSPVITDFGLARTLEGAGRMTKEGSALGTPFYMPPEQVTGELEGIGPRSDVYSMGVMLYEMLTACYPHDGATIMEVYQSILTQEPTRPRSIARDIDADLEAICLKAIDRDADFRYASAEEFADDLRHWRLGEPVMAARSSWGRRFARAVRRHYRSVLAAASIVVITGVLALGLVHLSQMSRRNRLVAQADGQFDAGRWRDAAVLYEQALFVDERHSHSRERLDLCRARLEAVERTSLRELLQQADALYGEQKWADAGKLYSKALAMDPKHAVAQRRQIECAAEQKALEGLARRRFLAGLDDYNQALQGLRERPDELDEARDRIDLAVREMTLAIDADPDYLEALVLRGRAHVLLNEPGDADDDFKRALEIDETNFPAAYERGKMLFLLWISEAALAVDYHPGRSPPFQFRADEPGDAASRARALAALEIAVENAEDDLDLAQALALRTLAAGDTIRAVQVYTKVLAIPNLDDLRRYECRLGRSIAFLRRGLPALARVDAADAARLRPLDYVAHTIAALCAMHAEKLDEAEREFSLAAAAQPAASSRRNLAITKLLLGKNDEALRLFEQLAEREPDDRDARLRVATLRFETNDLEGALRDVDAVLGRWPFSGDALGLKATILHEMGDGDRALDLMEQAYGLSPGDDNIVANYAALVAMVREDLARASELAREALKLNPRNSVASNVLGTAAAHEGDLPGALKHFESAYRDGGDDRSFLNLAVTYLELKRPRDAVTLIERDLHKFKGATKDKAEKILDEARRMTEDF